MKERLELTSDIVDAMIDSADPEACIAVHVKMMVESGWSESGACSEIACALARLIREERAAQRQVHAVLEEYAMPEAYLR